MSRSDDVMGQRHYPFRRVGSLGQTAGQDASSTARNLGREEILRQLQDISEDESDASDDDIFDPNWDENEDYEPPRVASDSSSDCDTEDTCRLEEELEDNVHQQVMPAMNVGQAGCST